MLLPNDRDTEDRNARLTALQQSTERYRQHNDTVEASLPKEKRIEIQARIRKTLQELKRTHSK